MWTEKSTETQWQQINVSADTPPPLPPPPPLQMLPAWRSGLQLQGGSSCSSWCNNIVAPPLPPGLQLLPHHRLPCQLCRCCCASAVKQWQQRRQHGAATCSGEGGKHCRHCKYCPVAGRHTNSATAAATAWQHGIAWGPTARQR